MKNVFFGYRIAEHTCKTIEDAFQNQVKSNILLKRIWLT